MKRLLSILSVCALCGVSPAQEMYEALVEPQLSENVAIRQASQEMPLLTGTVAGVPSAETSPYLAPSPRVTKEGKMKKAVLKGGHRGLDFGVDLDFMVQKGGGSFSPDITIGKRFSKNFYAGLAGGPQIPFQGGGVNSGTVAADFKYLYPLPNRENLLPGGMLRIGYYGDFSDYSYVMFSIMPTFQFVASKTVDLNCGLGFAEYVHTGSGGANSAAFAIKVGFDVHKPAEHQKIMLRHNATVDSGLELTLEAGGEKGFGGSPGATIDGGAMGALVLSYKLNPHLSLGAGFAAGSIALYKEEALTSIRTYLDGTTADYGVKAAIDAPDNNWSYKLFLRGNYRILKGNHSPFVSCDLGLFHSGATVDSYTYKNTEGGPSVSPAVFCSPAIGYSFRTTSNSYLFAKVGYTFSSHIFKPYEEVGKSYMTTYKYDIGASGLCFSVGYTHTFRCWQRKKKNK